MNNKNGDKYELLKHLFILTASDSIRQIIDIL